MRVLEGIKNAGSPCRMWLLTGCFDNLTPNETAALNQASLINLRSLQPAYIVWIIAPFLNIPAAILTFLTVKKSKSMEKTITNVQINVHTSFFCVLCRMQACTLIVCYSKLLFGAIVQSDRGSNDEPYFTILNTTSGLSNFVIYLICMK
uniref:Uncharacterized protein n=1 Tax=Romanomermis culicivorax TaxID=13658 RepID=A0A915IWM5_ROMCU